MQMDLKLFAERSRYRLGSTVLISLSCMALASVMIGVPEWLAIILGFAAAIALTIITYHRLSNANLSSGWLLLMIVQVGVGPSWHLSDHVTIHLVGSIICLVPVVLGWFAPAAIYRKTEPKAA